MQLVDPIQPASPADDIPAALRLIAQQIEDGDYDLITSAALVLGHTSERPGAPGYLVSHERVEVFGMGPRHDVFTVRGLLLSGAMESRLVNREEEPD